MDKNTQNLLENIMSYVFSKHRKFVIYFVVVVVLVLSMIYTRYNVGVASRENVQKELGQVSVLIQQKKMTEAQERLSQIISSTSDDLLLAKSHLLQGHIYFHNRKYDLAKKSYESVKTGDDMVLISAAALFGLGLTEMNLKEYEIATKTWLRYLDNYGKDKLEQRDKAPVITRTLWNLVLCYRLLDMKDKAQNVYDSKLLAFYPKSPQTDLAKKLLLSW